MWGSFFNSLVSKLSTGWLVTVFFAVLLIVTGALVLIAFVVVPLSSALVTAVLNRSEVSFTWNQGFEIKQPPVAANCQRILADLSSLREQTAGFRGVAEHELDKIEKNRDEAKKEWSELLKFNTESANRNLAPLVKQYDDERTRFSERIVTTVVGFDARVSGIEKACLSTTTSASASESSSGSRK